MRLRNSHEKLLNANRVSHSKMQDSFLFHCALKPCLFNILCSYYSALVLLTKVPKMSFRQPINPYDAFFCIYISTFCGFWAHFNSLHTEECEFLEIRLP